MSERKRKDWLYKNPEVEVEVRVRDLLSRMTLKEKIGQMTLIERRVASPSAIKDYCIGSILRCGGSPLFEGARSSDWADMIDEFQRWAVETRLMIPILFGIDAVHGNNNIVGTTIFPHNIGLGATRDANLVKRIGAVTALEVRASGAPWTFAPCVAVARDPRWGRTFESYGDTEIVRNMTSLVSGLQGEPPEGHPIGYPFVAGRNNVVSCAKHFVGDGGTKMGKNEGNTIATYEELEKIHMAPYLDCLAQGVSIVLASYSSWNGDKMHTHHNLLTEVLKNKLGFKGLLVSDWEALNRLTDPPGLNYRNCVKDSINAGIDMVMVPFKFEEFIADLASLVESGEILMSRIDDAVKRILRVKFIAGLFENPFSDRSLLDLVGCKEHRELGRQAVRKSLVLLKNGKKSANPFLPLDRNAKKILVTGTHADNLGYQCGGWTVSWSGHGGKITAGTTILDAVKKIVGSTTEVIYEKHPSEETFSIHDFTYAIVAVGEEPYAETLGDDSKLEIHLNGSKILKNVSEKIPTLGILITGRPVVLEPIVLENVEALVAAWLPGTEGQGITDVLFGDYDFKGKLPMPWFRRVGQLPMNANANGYDPLFHLGFGLNYKE